MKIVAITVTVIFLATSLRAMDNTPPDHKKVSCWSFLHKKRKPKNELYQAKTAPATSTTPTDPSALEKTEKESHHTSASFTRSSSSSTNTSSFSRKQGCAYIALAILQGTDEELKKANNNF